jgi:hypothetical protein
MMRDKNKFAKIHLSTFFWRQKQNTKQRISGQTARYVEFWMILTKSFRLQTIKEGVNPIEKNSQIRLLQQVCGAAGHGICFTADNPP